MKKLLTELNNSEIEFEDKQKILKNQYFKQNFNDDDKKLVEELNQWFEKIDQGTGAFVNHYNETNKQIDNNPNVKRLKETIKDHPVHSGELGKNKINSLKTLRDAYYTAKTSEFIENVDVSTEDIIIFIIYIFVLRGVSLFLLKWMIEINMVTTLEEALMAYAGVYLLLFLITLSLVNINTVDMTDIKSLMYYMYMKTTSNYSRIYIHIIVFSMMILIPFIISEEQRDEYIYTYMDSVEKRNIHRVISVFSLLIWIVLSMLSIIIL